MAGETSFRREPVVEERPQEISQPLTEVSNEATELPPSLYAESHKVPLVLELIGGASAYEHFDMTLLTREVDRYIIEEITRKGLEDTHDDYQKILNEALDTLNLPEGTDVYTMVEKLVKHFRIQHKLYMALKEKEELMQKDPLDMTSAQLKTYLERTHGL